VLVAHESPLVRGHVHILGEDPAAESSSW
jgi:hypothetical protein